MKQSGMLVSAVQPWFTVVGYIVVSLQRTFESKDLRVYERKIACCVPPDLNALGHRKPILLMGEIGLTI